jgi:hypothetical protein
MQLLRERRAGRNREEREEAGQRLRLCRQEVAVPAQELSRVADVVEHRSRLHRLRDWMPAERERRDDAEVAAATANCPKKVGVALEIRLNDRSVGEDDRGGDEIVDRQSGTTRKVADAAAERQATDSGRRDDPGRDGEPVLVRCAVDLPEPRTALHAHHPRTRVDRDCVHRRQVDHEPVVDAREPCTVVSAATHCKP